MPSPQAAVADAAERLGNLAQGMRSGELAANHVGRQLEQIAETLREAQVKLDRAIADA